MMGGIMAQLGSSPKGGKGNATSKNWARSFRRETNLWGIRNELREVVVRERDRGIEYTPSAKLDPDTMGGIWTKKNKLELKRDRRTRGLLSRIYY